MAAAPTVETDSTEAFALDRLTDDEDPRITLARLGLPPLADDDPED